MNNNNLVDLKILWKLAKDNNIDKYIKNIEYSNDNKHKYIITNINNKKIKIGNINYEDYLIHKDNKRRSLFRSRFNKLYQKFKNNIDSKILYTFLLLW